MACLVRESGTHGPMSCGRIFTKLNSDVELHLLRVGGVVRHARSLVGLAWAVVYLLRCESCRVIELPTHTSASLSRILL